YQGMEMVQVSELRGPTDIALVEQQLVKELVNLLGYEQVEFSTEAEVREA
ncbi:octanoyltransferase, partial [Vibrio vulnificus]